MVELPQLNHGRAEKNLAKMFVERINSQSRQKEYDRKKYPYLDKCMAYMTNGGLVCIDFKDKDKSNYVIVPVALISDNSFKICDKKELVDFIEYSGREAKILVKISKESSDNTVYYGVPFPDYRYKMKAHYDSVDVEWVCKKGELLYNLETAAQVTNSDTIVRVKKIFNLEQSEEVKYV